MNQTQPSETKRVLRQNPFRSLLNVLTFVVRMGGPVRIAKVTLAIVKASGVRATFMLVRHVLFGNSSQPGVTYQQWHDRFLKLTKARIRDLSRQVEAIDHPPLISILMPTYNSNLEHLSKAIQSVRNQIYANWELCIADDASTIPECREFLEMQAKDEPRIKLLYREKNGHISEATNSAFSISTGEYFALLDHDDELTIDALAIMALAATANPEVDFFYSDEDKLDAAGELTQPHFKPDLNRTLALANNYFCHLSMYKRDLFYRVGGFRTEFNGAQDYDFVLRILELLPDNKILHIPFALYHWRITQNSTSGGSEAKPYTRQAALNALQQHLNRQNLKGSFASHAVHADLNVVSFELTATPLVSIVIPTRDQMQILKTCLDSLFALTDYPNFEVIVVDNQSVEPETLEYFRSLEPSRVRVIEFPHPFNYSAINNFAVSQAKGDFVCLLNNDIEVVHADWLTQMMSLAQFQTTGAVGARLFYPNGLVQHGGVVLGLGGLSGVAGHSHKLLTQDHPGYFGRALVAQEYSAVTAACLVVSKAKYLEVGGLTEELSVAFNDVDFCLKLLTAGYKNLWTPNARLIHHESVSRGLDRTREQIERATKEVLYMRQTWGELLDNDPAYNRHLTRYTEDFALAWPPTKAKPF